MLITLNQALVKGEKYSIVNIESIPNIPRSTNKFIYNQR
jgi:hypothetical protein